MILQNKIVLITGASGGIGMALAREFGKHKAKLILHYANTKINIDTLQEELAKQNIESFSVQADFKSTDGIKSMFDTIKGKYGQLDVLVNNAGIFKTHENSFDTSQWNDELRVNLFAAVECADYAMSLMTNGGVIINISSVSGVERFGEMFSALPYAVSKAGMNRFSEILAIELAPKVRVVSISPGYVLTPQWNSTSDEDKKSSTNEVPIKRFITPEEVAEFTVAIAQNDAITGQNLLIDGGLAIRKF